MSYQRIDRISEEVRREVDAVIREELHDPRVSGTYSVTRAEVTGDLRYAKIYVSVLEDEKRDGLMEALKNARGYIRHALGRRMIIRFPRARRINPFALFSASISSSRRSSSRTLT